MREERYAYRLPPCPSWDVEGMESWLGDMAAQGLFLSVDGFFLGIAVFERREPQLVKYRLEAVPKQRGLFSDPQDGPDTEARELNEEYGWSYVAKYGQFYIYCSHDPLAREPNTDPEVQALAFRALCRRQRSNLLSTFLWFILYPLLLWKGSLLLFMVNLGSWFVLLGILLTGILLADSLRELVHLGKLRKRLKAGSSLDHTKNWQRRAMFHRIFTVSDRTLSVLWLCLLVIFGLNRASGAREILIREYPEPAPFATLADLYPEGDYQAYMEGLIDSTVEVRQDLLAPENWEWKECGKITYPDGSTRGGILRVSYHETASPWLAKLLALEYRRLARTDKDFREIALPEITADFAFAYRDSLHHPTVILQKGHRIVCASFSQLDGEIVPLETWSPILADSLG